MMRLSLSLRWRSEPGALHRDVFDPLGGGLLVGDECRELAHEADSPRPASVQDQQTFQVLASIAFARWRRRLAPKAVADLEWRLRTAMNHFGDLPLGGIGGQAADEFGG
jgi:hypothetical protein